MRLLASISLAINLAATAADHCVSVSGAGSKDGSDWNNSFQGFPANPTRGDTYYFASGTYGALTLNKAASSTLTITLRGATIASHGPATGWDNAMAGQAEFPESSVSTPYWIFDGQSRTSWTNGYTLYFHNASSYNGACINLSSGADHIIWQYCEFKGTATHQDASDTDFCINGADTYTDWYIGYCYLHESGNSTIQCNNASTSDQLTIERCYFYKNHCNRNSIHDETLAITWNNMVNRWNIYKDFMSTACIANPSGGDPVMSNWYIYGNVFFWDSEFQNDSGVFVGNGITGFPNDTFNGTLRLFNNTIVGVKRVSDSNLSSSGFDLPSGGSHTVYIENNLWYDCDSVGGFADTDGTVDYNSYFGPDCENGYDESTHKVYVATLPTIFNNATLNDYSLAGRFTGTTNGVNVGGIPYNLDLAGNTRSTWNRGAYEYQTGGSTPTRTANAVTVHVGTMTQPAP